MAVLLVLVVMAPSFIIFSAKGPGFQRAPIAAALVIALVVGVLAQRPRLCMVGGIRDAVMFKDFRLISGFAAGRTSSSFMVNLSRSSAVSASMHRQPFRHSTPSPSASQRISALRLRYAAASTPTTAFTLSFLSLMISQSKCSKFASNVISMSGSSPSICIKSSIGREVFMV